MFTKKEFKEERRRLRADLCGQIFQLRQTKGLTLSDLSILSGIPIHRVEALELFGLMKLHITELQILANCYNKYVKIELVDKEEL